MDTLYIQFYSYLRYHPFLIPLGAIGIWRWTVWMVKRGVASFYKPQSSLKKTENLSVSVVTPVYNENPDIFLKAVKSWEKNKPKEIIAVIDHTDKACIRVFEEYAKDKESFARLIITKKPGKRPALADGIRVAKGEILALIDSDTIWDRDVLKNAVIPFADKKVGGVGTRQSVMKTDTLAQKLFSIRLDQRYWDDVPFLAYAGDVQGCLSGRTAFYRRSVVLPLLPKFLDERFFGEKVISGEDKRLTYLVAEKNWKLTYQGSANVSTTGVPDLKTFLQQQVRWTRNSWRADLRAIKDRWPFRHPIFAVYLIDRAIQPFTLLLSPIYFALSLYFKLWVPAIIIFLWWHLSRGVKMIPHLRHKPQDILILPSFVLLNFVTAGIRIYALLSLNQQGWITRWNKARLPQYSPVRLIPAYVGTFAIILLVSTGAFVYKEQTYFAPELLKRELVTQRLPERKSSLLAYNPNVLGASVQKSPNLLTSKHEVKEGDSLPNIAFTLNTNYDNFVGVNASKITRMNYLDPGIILNIPSQKVSLTPVYKFNIARIYPDVLQVYVDPVTDTINVAGRGKQITLKDIREGLGEEYIQEVSPKVWRLKSSLYLASGTTLRLNKDEVEWLQLASNSKKFINITGYNATVLVNSVKITSWDETNNNFDTNLADGRSFIVVKDGSRMDIANSEVAYLGHPRTPELRTSPYGISWKMSKGKLGTTILTGDVVNSKFHHNYFGAYTFGATGMTWKGNEFYENVKYGLDPHDDSNGFLVENNSFHNNGSHGLIFSKRCVDNIIRNNLSYNNKLHGIMLHHKSEKNRIENNKLYGNTAGIALNDASNSNLIVNNQIYNNKHGVRANMKSVKNVMNSNKITNNSEAGIYFYEGSDENVVTHNLIAGNKYAVYLKTNNNYFSDNTISSNTIGFYLLDKAAGNQISNNRIADNDSYPIYAKLIGHLTNYLDNNSLSYNKRDPYVKE